MNELINGLRFCLVAIAKRRYGCRVAASCLRPRVLLYGGDIWWNGNIPASRI